jgi:heterodisulfide reductase subunit C
MIKNYHMKIRISKERFSNELLEQVRELSEQNFQACYQCGKCSAGCPSIEPMDAMPSQVIRLVQLGQVEKALATKTIWLCAACHICKVRCPKGVDLAGIMEALRQIVLRENVNYVHPNAISEEDLENLPQIALIANFRKLTH